MQPIIGSPHERYYRNKLFYLFSTTLPPLEEIAVRNENDSEPALSASMQLRPVWIRWWKYTPVTQHELTKYPKNVLRQYTVAKTALLMTPSSTYRLAKECSVIRVTFATGEVLVNLVVAHEDKTRKGRNITAYIIGMQCARNNFT
jgi:hypothetical protein